MRYLLIDHITEWKPGEFIKGVKNVAMSEDFLEFHFPKNPIMPGVMLLEALAQLSGWLEAASSDFKNWFLISNVRKSNFYSFALPGDQVELEVQVLPPRPPVVKGGKEGDAPPTPSPLERGAGVCNRGEVKVYRGIGTVKGKKKIVAEFEGEVVPIAEIEDAEEQRRFFRILTREIKISLSV
ncbi:MAG: beta-hydroxyacyl-ACP dehydratase [Nitrospirae bacterium]|nr:beta-hydroxyacyl-ACP dehydratase [Nitrospirota bacterium]